MSCAQGDDKLAPTFPLAGARCVTPRMTVKHKAAVHPTLGSHAVPYAEPHEDAEAHAAVARRRCPAEVSDTGRPAARPGEAVMVTGLRRTLSGTRGHRAGRGGHRPTPPAGDNPRINQRSLKPRRPPT